MTSERDDELEALLQGLDPAARAEVREAHRLLEHDLARLVDPLPPPDFVQGVMARVEAAPARAMTRTDQAIAALIVVTTAAAGLGALSIGGLGLTFTRFALALRDTILALATGLSALWSTAALPLSVGLLVSMFFTLLLFRRFALPARAQVIR